MIVRDDYLPNVAQEDPLCHSCPLKRDAAPH